MFIDLFRLILQDYVLDVHLRAKKVINYKELKRVLKSQVNIVKLYHVYHIDLSACYIELIE